MVNPNRTREQKFQRQKLPSKNVQSTTRLACVIPSDKSVDGPRDANTDASGSAASANPSHQPE
ncbi:hypothetical protein SAMD00023353_3800080 [Rosellinia necatrix]|uniref:Uncharacterized protein n=1 Tax=Rosellinia necatrix TaxID=77044 RepID=A0A1S8A908_ROSNE|nr:hypothetical protein SAMD00023353_3800080 [Rosellinia necatrix]